MPAKTPRNHGVLLKQRARAQDLSAVDSILTEAHAERAKRETKQGRKISKFNREAVCILLDALVRGVTVQKACEEADIGISTLYQWMKLYPRLTEVLARAKQEGAEGMLYAAVDAAMSAVDRESAICARVKADTLLKVASKIDPARYGDQPNQNAGVVVNITTNLEPPLMDDEGIYTITVPASSGALAPLTAPPST